MNGSTRPPTNAWENYFLELKIEDSLASLSTAAKQIALWFADMENKTSEKGYRFRFAFYQLFHDQCYDISYCYQPETIFNQVQNVYTHPPDKEQHLFALVLCKGLFFYLIEEERYRKLDAFLIVAYTGWQWYDLMKQLLLEESLRTNFGWLDEMAIAFRHLSALLDNRDFSDNKTWSRLFDSQKSYLKTKDLEYRLRVESICANQGQKPFGPAIISQKISDYQICWDPWKGKQINFNLHPVFVSHRHAQAAVRNLASNIFLRDYDFETALRLANLLGKRRLNLRRFPLWLSILVLLIVLSTMAIAAGSLIAGVHGSVNLSLDKMVLPILVEWAIVGIPIWIVLINCFDHRLLPRLLMPRLAGGVLVGFSVLATQNDAVNLSHVLWSQGFFLPVLLWLAVVAMAVIYLYGDIRPLVKDNAEVVRRIVQSVLIFIAFSLGMGLFILPLPTAAFSSPPPLSDWILGPTGWVDITLWLTYSPLALFIGLMTQFLFEEKTITSPVWQVEKE